MIDDATIELLSRHLDGDLSAAEAAELEERMAEDQELAAEAERLAELRHAVSSLAARMQPPEELDALLEPLRRSGRPPRRLRPAHRWLAAAAMVTIGVTVGLEVARRRPGPEIPAPQAATTPAARPMHAEKDYYQLQPLPTASPEEAELIGAADHLLATDPPEPMPEEPPVLDVYGPLPMAETTEADEVSGAASEKLEENGGFAPVPDEVVEAPAAPARSKSAAAAAGERSPNRKTHQRSASEGSALRDTEARRDLGRTNTADLVTVAGARLVVVVDGQTYSFPCARTTDLAIGRHTVVIAVADSQVLGCGADAEDRSSIACQLVEGVAVEGLADGDYRAELVVTEVDDPKP